MTLGPTEGETLRSMWIGCVMGLILWSLLVGGLVYAIGEGWLP